MGAAERAGTGPQWHLFRRTRQFQLHTDVPAVAATGMTHVQVPGVSSCTNHTSRFLKRSNKQDHGATQKQPSLSRKGGEGKEGVPPHKQPPLSRKAGEG